MKHTTITLAETPRIDFHEATKRKDEIELVALVKRGEFDPADTSIARYEARLGTTVIGTVYRHLHYANDSKLSWRIVFAGLKDRWGRPRMQPDGTLARMQVHALMSADEQGLLDAPTIVLPPVDEREVTDYVTDEADAEAARRCKSYEDEADECDGSDDCTCDTCHEARMVGIREQCEGVEDCRFARDRHDHHAMDMAELNGPDALKFTVRTY